MHKSRVLAQLIKGLSNYDKFRAPKTGCLDLSLIHRRLILNIDRRKIKYYGEIKYYV